LAAVGAPSSLAVSAAHSFGMTICGFVRQNRYNVYCNNWRLQLPPEPTPLVATSSNVPS